jgi:hypothetical protein
MRRYLGLHYRAQSNQFARLPQVLVIKKTRQSNTPATVCHTPKIYLFLELRGAEAAGVLTQNA